MVRNEWFAVSQRIVIAFTVVFVVLICIVNMGRPIFTDDFWWHLRLGEVLIDEGFPDRDPLLFTGIASAPFLHEWLFQALIALVERLGGLFTLRFIHVALGLTVIFCVYRFLRFSGLQGKAAAAGILVYFLLAYQRLIQFRPQLLSMSIFFLMLILLMRWERVTIRRGLALMGLTALWANLHSIFVVVFPFWALLILAKAGSAEKKKDIRSHGYGFVGCILAGLANPRGYEAYVFYFKHNAVNPAQAVVDDFGHYLPWLDVHYLPQASLPANLTFLAVTLLYLPLLALFFRDYFRREDGEDPVTTARRLFLALSAGLAIAMMIYAIRFVWLVPIAYAFVLGELARRRMADRVGSPVQLLVVVALAVTVVAHYLQPAMDRYAYRFRSTASLLSYISDPADRAKYMESAVRFLEEIGIGGNVFNYYAHGGYIAWRLGPAYKTFIDGRQDRYPPAVFRDYLAISQEQPDMLEAITHYDFDFFIVPVADTSFRLRLALAGASWARVFQDGRVSVLAAPQTFDRAPMQEALAGYYGLTTDSPALSSPAAFNEWLEELIVSQAFTAPSEFGDLELHAWRKELNSALQHHFFQHATRLAAFGEARWGIPVRESRQWEYIEELIEHYRLPSFDGSGVGSRVETGVQEG